jgi:hypothetical protein
VGEEEVFRSGGAAAAKGHEAVGMLSVPLAAKSEIRNMKVAKRLARH